MFKISITVIISSLLCGARAYSRCPHFENGPPGYCASVVVGEKMPSARNKCLYSISVNSVKPVLPNKREFPHLQELFKNQKTHVVEVKDEYCKDNAGPVPSKGVLTERCNDNISKEYELWIKLKKFFGALDTPYRFFYTKPETILSETNSLKAQCDDF